MNANQSVPSGVNGQPPVTPAGGSSNQVPPQYPVNPAPDQGGTTYVGPQTAASYPPQQPMYPQQQGYPPQQQGYPPKQPGYPPQQPGYPPAGYPPMYAPAPQKKSKVWIPILIGGLVLLAVAFTFLAISGIFPARPELTLSVTKHNFGDQFIYSDYDGKTVEVMNSGHGKLVIDSIALDDEKNYAVSDDGCSGKSLGRNDSCSFTVAFVPQSSGSKDTTVEVISNAKTSPDSIALNGKAVIPPCDIAILGAIDSEWMNDIKSKLKGVGFFDSIDTFDVSDSTLPTLEYLKGFSAVMVFSDMSLGDASGLGDVLADYVDAGGGVVVTTFAFNENYENELVGRISNDGYLPFDVGPQNNDDLLTMVPDLSDHPILLGVNSFNGGSSSYHEEISLANGATLVAHWSNGVPLIAVLEIGDSRVAGLNFYPVSSDMREDFWDTSTDGARLMANAMAWAGHCYTGE